MILPDPSFSEVFGTGTTYNPCVSFEEPGWLPPDRSALDFLSGGQLVALGGMPAVCARAVVTRRSVELLDAAGLSVPDDLRTYDSHESYRSVLRQLARGAGPVAMQHVHPERELAGRSYLVPPDVLSRLNNKANLGELVPADHVPPRTTLTPAALNEMTARAPVAIKAATDESTGGGYAVRVCRTSADVDQARQFFARCTAVVVEPLLTMEQNLCVQYSAAIDGEVRYIGTSEQVIDSNGRYAGNWLHRGTELPAAVELGRVIMERAVASGYRGFAGFDMAVTSLRRLLVFDLNFRTNGSTVSLLLLRSVEEILGPQVVRLRSWTTSKMFGQVADVVKRWVADGALLPLCVYDPGPATERGRETRLMGMVLGASRSEVREREARLRSALTG